MPQERYLNRYGFYCDWDDLSEDEMVELARRAEARSYVSIMNLATSLSLIAALLLIPCLCQGFIMSLLSFSSRLEELIDLIDERKLQYARYSEDDQETCSSKYKNAVPVHLLTSTIDLLALSESGPKDGSEPLPLAEQINGRTEHVSRLFVYNQHWALSIRDVRYELLRRKGTTEIKIKITDPGEKPSVDALGVPLQQEHVEQLGVTFLSDADIRKRIDISKNFRRLTNLTKYHPLKNNCQIVWTTGLLDHIVCQCPDQKQLNPPETANEHLVARKNGGSAHQVAFILLVLKARGYFFAWPNPWTRRSYFWLNVVFELGIYALTIQRFLPSPGLKSLVRRSRNRYTSPEETRRLAVAADANDTSEVLSAANPKETQKLLDGWRRHLDNIPLTEDESQVWWYLGLFFPLLLLESFVSYMHRFGGYPSFEIVEIILTMVVMFSHKGVAGLARDLRIRPECKANLDLANVETKEE